MSIVVINATAARASGALTILKDFMSYIYSETENDFIFHLLTTTNNIFKSEKNIFVHEIPIQSWKTRLLWDKYGFQNWCLANGIIPEVVISFQNTCPRLTGALQSTKLLVYYHQPLPLVKYHWKWQQKDERKLFLYAHFYGLFVNRWNKNADYIVQLPYIKQLFLKKFKNIKSDRVHVIRPNLPKIDINSIERISIDETKKVFIYPAIPVRYKNHKVIINAIEMLRGEKSFAIDNLEIIFTVPNDSIIANEVKNRKLDSIIKCIGSIPYEELLTYYKRCDGLLFPSEIETFGLPLIEAAMFGKPIIAADLPYAREVLENYVGVLWANPNDITVWKENLRKVMSSEINYISIKNNNSNTWKDFISLISTS